MSDQPQISPARVEFDTRLFSADVIQRAALKFSDLCSFSFSLPSDTTIAVHIEVLEGQAGSIHQLISKLRNEVLDQQLRERIAKETESERNLILAYAFSNTKLIQP